MEKLSSFERVVGNIPTKEKERVLREKGEIFDDQVFDKLKGKERPKSPEELKIISLVNDETNEIRRRYGLEDFDVPADNIHIIKKSEWPKEKGAGITAGYFTSDAQAIVMLEPSNKLGFMKKVFHEMLHFKSYNALQATDEEEPKIREYRVGLTIADRKGKAARFVNLNEAVTEEMTKQFSRKVAGNKIFEEEKKKTQETIAKYPGSMTEQGQPMFNSDTLYAETGKRFPDGTYEIKAERFTYTVEREILYILINKLIKKGAGDVKNKQEGFEIFAKGMMTGNILPIGRLIDGTFGKGTLRKIGELDEDIHKQKKFVEAL